MYNPDDKKPMSDNERRFFEEVIFPLARMKYKSFVIGLIAEGQTTVHVEFDAEQGLEEAILISRRINKTLLEFRDNSDLEDDGA